MTGCSFSVLFGTVLPSLRQVSHQDRKSLWPPEQPRYFYRDLTGDLNSTDAPWTHLQEVGSDGLNEVLLAEVVEHRGMHHVQELLFEEVQRLAVHPGRPVRLAAPVEDHDEVVDADLVRHQVLTA